MLNVCITFGCLDIRIASNDYKKNNRHKQMHEYMEWMIDRVWGRLIIV